MELDSRGQWSVVNVVSAHHLFCPLSGVLSLVTVQPTTVPVAKQLLPKTLGPSNVNITAHMQHVPHMVSESLRNACTM